MFPRSSKMLYNPSELIRYTNYLSLKTQTVEIIRNIGYDPVNFIAHFKIRSNDTSAKIKASCNFFKHV